MNVKMFERVALTRDLEAHGLKRGDVATVVDTAIHPQGGQPGVVLEVFNALGESISVVIATEADIEPLSWDEVLSVRHFTKAG